MPNNHYVKPATRHGAALIIVLSFLVLITVLIVAFYSSVTTEYISTKTNSYTVNSRQLADSAVQLVMAQIKDATSQKDMAWASQPGMIRTFGTDAKLKNAYKLYSDSTLVDKTGAYDPFNDWAPTNWTTLKGVYTDLNAPVVSGGTSIYPIMDPAAALPPSGSGTGPSLVDGTTLDSNATPLKATGNTNKAAMPIKWLYILKDGTIAPVSDPSTVAIKGAGVVLADKTTNDIVGRIAFWTDDETCKLNINTASEGSYWDQPTFCATQEAAFSMYQPATREYFRYPGHPATTSLSPVLWSLFLKDPSMNLNAVPSAFFDTSADPQPQLDTSAQTYLSAVMSLSPRTIWGGSKAGSVITLGGAGAITSSSLDGDRLYASLDELVYSPPASSDVARPLNNKFLSASKLAQFRFFLTANSRAPEVNPFNLPKVTMWPIPDTKPNPVNGAWPTTKAAMSPLDQTIAFCSTLNTKPYYFTRSDPTSSTADFTQRNKEVYNYLRNLMDKEVPGFGGAFAGGTKWNALQANQITTLVYDYIRSCINLVDSSKGTTAAPDYTYSYTTPPSTTKGPTYGSGQVVPISITNPNGTVTKGIGRFPTVRGSTLQFIARGSDQPPLLVYPSGTFSRCPVIFYTDAAGNEQSWNGTGSSIPDPALTEVLKGTAYAKINTMHPWTCPQVGNVKQLGSPGTPVFAVNTTALSSNANDTTAIYPIFDLSGVNTSGTAPTRTYPTLDFVGGANGLYCAAPPTGAAAAKIKYGTPAKDYPYLAAANLVKQAPGYTTLANPFAPQTHAGLPYLTAQRASGTTLPGKMQGAFDIPNPNYADVAITNPYQTRVEAILILDPVNVASGLVGMLPDCQFRVSGLDSYSANGNPLGFTSPATEVIQNNISGGGGNHPQPWMPIFLYDYGWQLTIANRYTNNAPNAYQQMPFFSKPTLVANASPSGSTFPFQGGKLKIEVLTAAGAVVQTLNMNFPTDVFPTPKLAASYEGSPFQDYPPTNIRGGSTQPGIHPAVVNDLVPGKMLTFDQTDSKLAWDWTGDGSTKKAGACRLNQGSTSFRALYMFIPSEMNCSGNSSDPSFPWGKAGLNKNTCDTFRSVEAQYGDLRLISSLANVPDTFFVKNPYYGYSTPYSVNGWSTYVRAAHSLRVADSASTGAQFGTLTDSALIDPTKAISPVNYSDSSTVPPLNGNQRLIVGPISGVPSPPNTTGNNILDFGMARGLSAYNGTGGHTEFPYTTPTTDFADSVFYGIWKNGGDFDNGMGMFSDGPFINKADEGSGQVGGTFITNPYFSINYYALGNSLFSANRQVPSSVMFGSLPVGFAQMGSVTAPSNAMLNDSWKTLLFCPNPNASDVTGRDARTAANGMVEAGKVPVASTVPDYLLLDFFHMPVVEPYPISEPFSTAGKVNMNYQIAPFSYITRSTALRGVLKSAMITAVQDQFIGQYKMRGSGNNGATFTDTKNPTTYSGGYNQFGADTGYLYFRYPVHAGETLKQFDERFKNKDIFRSPSEFCSLWLYPAAQPTSANATSAQTALVSWDSNNANIKSWWYGTGKGDKTRKSLTGDNQRERPYATIYPRLTTKSNTYTVHYKVQTLKKVPGTSKTQWVEGKDQMVSEYRGSSLIERYIDPNDPNLPDFATNTTASLDDYYKFRTVSTKKFSPQ